MQWGSCFGAQNEHLPRDDIPYSCTPHSTCIVIVMTTFFFPQSTYHPYMTGICGKILLVESRISWALESGTLLREIRNPSKDWNPESKFHWQEVESSSLECGIQGLESRIQDCLGFPYMGRPRIPRNILFLFAALRFLGTAGNSIFQLPWNFTPLVPRNSYKG